MHKKLEAELLSLAHSILQMENKSDINALQEKSRMVYEKLTVLKFVDNNLANAFATVEEKENKTEHASAILVEETVLEVVEKEEAVVQEVIDEPVVEEEVLAEVEVEEPVKTTENTPQFTETHLEDLIEEENELAKNDVRDVAKMQFTIEDELKDAISSDVATELFEKATKEHPVIEDPEPVIEKKRSLNDAIFNSNIQVGLNDRIAFVKNLFDGSQEDFNRVLSQLNSFDSEVEAKKFIKNFVKPDYNWSGKEEYEERLNVLIERKFL